MDVRITNEKTRTFWDRASSAIKFQKGGLWGLKSQSGDIILPADYDKIEICTDFVYVHYGNRHKYFYKNDSTSDCADRDDDDRFYENGKIGILNQDGSVFLPAIYDEIIDWGRDCDVIYVRSGNEFCYYNHDREKILTDFKIIEEDEYPEYPYGLGEDQNREVLICVEPVSKIMDNRSCYAYGQWCRLDRIPRKEIAAIFDNCNLIPVNDEIIRNFYNDFTYIYSARFAMSRTIMDSVRKFETLGCYDSDWSYLVKICVNHRTNIDPHDLYMAIQYFENLYSMHRMTIAADYDDSLEDGIVSVFQVHYYREGAYPNDYIEDIISNGSLDDVISGYELQEDKFIVKDDALYKIEFSEQRSWKETEKVLNYLYSVGVNNVNNIMRRNIYLNPFWIESITNEMWKFKRHVIKWAIDHGAQLNIIRQGKTLTEAFADELIHSKEFKKDKSDAQESIKNAEEFVSWLKLLGGITAAEQRLKIESKLDGHTPKEVLDLIATT